VARELRDLPVIRARFAAARLSYAKVRALTRIATPQNEAGLTELAGPMTGNQLERFARAHRSGKSGQLVQIPPHAGARSRLPHRRVTWLRGHVTSETIIPPWYGERLDLDRAIWVCFANARTEEQERADREQAHEPVFRPRTWVSDLNDTVNYFRRRAG
jgi:hypothetical protein